MRALLIVLDSVGIGHAPDAEQYGDSGANTLGHILQNVASVQLPNLCRLGLTEIVHEANIGPSKQPKQSVIASFGKMQERSAGKDTTTGHWELAGPVLARPFAVFRKFPDELVRPIEHEAGVKFIGNFAASGTTILQELGFEHISTGHPILYTSADSVLQIAAHEEVVPIQRLYEICGVARRHADPFRIGRVIARPFIGKERFTRTPNRHDFSMKPPRTILNALRERGLPIIGVGKISDIFAGEGITHSYPTKSNAHGMQTIAQLWSKTSSGFMFANLVDFDSAFGHRRDVAGYATALVEFDQWLGPFLDNVVPEDLVIITADHGNDPTFPGTDHTREQVPLFVVHKAQSRDLGTRSSYADVAASLAQFFDLPEPWPTGCSFLPSCTSPV
jgi:phosphopentomutase